MPNKEEQLVDLVTGKPYLHNKLLKQSRLSPTADRESKRCGGLQGSDYPGNDDVSISPASSER